MPTGLHAAPMRYSAVAIWLHWTIAAAIVLQVASGFWMVRAIHIAGSQALAFDAYQWHKSLGMTVLTLSARMAAGSSTFSNLDCCADS